MQLSATLVLLCVMCGCPEGKTEKAEEVVSTETAILPGGEIVTKESFRKDSPDGVRRSKLFFQEDASSQRELIIDFIDEAPAALSLNNAAIELHRGGDRKALRIGIHVFQRWVRHDGPYWCDNTTNPDPTASVFLRSFLPSGDARIVAPPSKGMLKWFEIPRPEVPYRFDRVDLEQNVFVTRRDSPDPTFPEFLVYSASQYGFPWRFDIERTRKTNGLNAPTGSHILIDFSVVTYPGDLKPAEISRRDTCLLLPGAKEIHTQTLPLSSSVWTGPEYSFTIPTGVAINDHFEVLFGFLDPLPEYVSVFWRHHPVLWEDWHFVKMGVWVKAAAGGYKGGLSRIAFFRLRQIQPK